MSEHYRTFSAVFPIIIRNDAGAKKILLHQRKNTGYQDGKWDFAGSGHVDEGETAKQAVGRECKEELGISVKCDALHFAHLSHRLSTDRTYYDMYFVVEAYEGVPAIMEVEKCSSLAWFDLDALPEDMMACRRKALQKALNNNPYSESDER